VRSEVRILVRPSGKIALNPAERDTSAYLPVSRRADPVDATH
jgi:hypothetical protein